MQPGGWLCFVNLPHAQRISLPRFTVTLTNKTKRKHQPLENFLTNTSARISETATEIRLSYLRVEEFQFSQHVIPTILTFCTPLTYSLYRHLSGISLQFNFVRPKPQTTIAAINIIQCTAFQQSSFSIQTQNTSFPPPPAFISQI